MFVSKQKEPVLKFIDTENIFVEGSYPSSNAIGGNIVKYVLCFFFLIDFVEFNVYCKIWFLSRKIWNSLLG